MKKTFIFLFVMLSIFVIVACSTTKATEEQPAQAPVSVAEPAPKAEPESKYPGWVFTPGSMDNSVYKYISGSSEISVSDKMARQQAMTDATRNFANWWETSIQAIVRDYANVAGEGMSNQQYMLAFETFALQKADVVVSGIEMVDQWKDPDTGELWVLARVPKATLGTTFQTVIDEMEKTEEFQKNPAAAEANNMMKSAFDDLINSGIIHI
jgi:hypothetical protein